jgi:DKNYY family
VLNFYARKQFICAGIGILLIMSPLFVSAQIVSTSSSSLIPILEQLVAVLIQEVQELIATHGNPPMITSTSVVPATVATTSSTGAPAAGDTASFLPGLAEENSFSAQNLPPVIDVEGNQSLAVKDATHVYGLQVDEEAYYLLPGADPNTFIAIDYEYGKDSTHVWLLGGSGADDEGGLTPGQIIGADPATFAPLPDWYGGYESEGFSNLYAKDKNHVYVDGTVIDGADPATFTVDDAPATTTVVGPTGTSTCLIDAQDKNNTYWQGTAQTLAYCLVRSTYQVGDLVQ